MKTPLQRLMLFFILLTFIIPFQNCSQSNLETAGGLTSSSASKSSDSNSSENNITVNNPRLLAPLGRAAVQQFGYWGSAFDSVNTDVAGEYIDELAGSSNVVFVSGIDSITKDISIDRIIAKVQKADKAGLGVVLHVQPFFYEWGSVRLAENGRTRFRELWKRLGKLQSTVQAFYIYDEPYGWNASAAERQIHASFVKDNLNYVAKDLKSVAPKVPSVVVFGPVEIDYTNFYSDLVPAEVSWIGFDCYRMEESHGRCTESDLRRHFKNFETVAIKNNQGLVLVPDAFAFQSPNDDDQYRTVSRLRLYKEFSTSWRVRAIYPWIYQDHTDANGQVLYWGARSLPHVKNELKIFFDVLANRAHCDSNLDLVYKSGEKWSKAPVCALSCENGQVTSRDADGAFYSQSGSCP